MGFLNRLPARMDTFYARNRMWRNKGSDTAANRRTVLSPSHVLVNIGGAGAHAYELEAAVELDLDTAANWDDAQYATAANRAGKDFYIYACVPVSGYTPVVVLSAATTYPAGYTADNSRKVGGFHCECVAVGTISGHALTGYLAGDILPRSVWDLEHRSSGPQAGMVWAGKTDFDTINYLSVWQAIYPASSTGANTASAFAAAASVSRDWYNFQNDLKAIGARMLSDNEFTVLFTGSPEETNISGSANPTTCGGHSDTGSRRIISNIGAEDLGGVWWTWLQTLIPYISGADVAAIEAYSWYDVAGGGAGSGSFYGQGGVPDGAALLAGGDWNYGADCGSRSRHAGNRRADSYSSIGCRFCAEPA